MCSRSKVHYTIFCMFYLYHIHISKLLIFLGQLLSTNVAYMGICRVSYFDTMLQIFEKIWAHLY